MSSDMASTSVRPVDEEAFTPTYDEIFPELAPAAQPAQSWPTKTPAAWNAKVKTSTCTQVRKYKSSYVCMTIVVLALA